MKTVNYKEKAKEILLKGLGEETQYQKFFKKALDKFGVDSPEDLSDEKKKEFFNYVDKNWKADDEEKESVREYAEKLIEGMLSLNEQKEMSIRKGSHGSVKQHNDSMFAPINSLLFTKKNPLYDAFNEDMMELQGTDESIDIYVRPLYEDSFSLQDYKKLVKFLRENVEGDYTIYIAGMNFPA